MGALSHLLAVPKQRNEIMIRVKRMQSEMTYHFRTFEGTHEEPIRFVLHVYAIYGDMFLKTKNAHCSCLLLLLTMSVFAFVLICGGREHANLLEQLRFSNTMLETSAAFTIFFRYRGCV